MIVSFLLSSDRVLSMIWHSANWQGAFLRMGKGNGEKAYAQGEIPTPQ